VGSGGCEQVSSGTGGQENRRTAPLLASPIVDGSPAIWPNSIAVGTPEEARRVVDDQKGKGADFIKVYSRLSRESYFAVIDESRKQNIPVEGHVPYRISVWEATAEKQKSQEHLLGIPVACFDLRTYSLRDSHLDDAPRSG
jgi:hypothetical protein